MSKAITTKKLIDVGKETLSPQERKASEEGRGQCAGNSEALMNTILEILISGEKIPFSIVLVVIGFIFIQDNGAGRLRNWRDLFWTIQKCSFPVALYLVFCASHFASQLIKKRNGKTTKKLSKKHQD